MSPYLKIKCADFSFKKESFLRYAERVSNKKIKYCLYGRKEYKMPVCNVSLQVIPKVKSERTYEVVDKVIEYIASCNIKYEVGPMETTMEGDLDILMEIVKKAQYICIEEGADRVISVVKIDFKPEGVTIDEKVAKYRR